MAKPGAAKPRAAKPIKSHAITLNGSVVSIHSSHAACIAELEYLRRNDTCTNKWRAHYTYEEVCAMRIAWEKPGYTIYGKVTN